MLMAERVIAAGGADADRDAGGDQPLVAAEEPELLLGPGALAHRHHRGGQQSRHEYNSLHFKTPNFLPLDADALATVDHGAACRRTASSTHAATGAKFSASESQMTHWLHGSRLKVAESAARPAARRSADLSVR